ncbi:hypothetical protein [Thermoplasma acidophilum]|uniref:Uncharacterized protein n=1 Tax=Thermoplasma acidophilum (strain ATCC 25905 / DSM 1728 / JCM 9062 / NBRC 15155 / AMRC-C165) TaxID=273075 RepID=Q9HKA3_THEAC|nr:hypothetical protein [Thermoplasma acidophilum]
MPMANIVHSFCTVSLQREKNMASRNMAIYLLSRDRFFHFSISGNVISVMRDMVDLLYLLCNNSSSISAIFLVDMPLEYLDNIRSSIPIDCWYYPDSVWNSSLRSLCTFRPSIFPYFLMRSPS